MKNSKLKPKIMKNSKFFRFDFLDLACRQTGFILSQKANGFTILLSVLVVSIVLSAGLGIFGVMTRELKLSGMGRESQLAFYAADAGIECFFYWEIKQSAFEPDGSSNTIKCAGSGDIALSDADITGNSSYSFNISLGAPTDPCVKVEVVKDYSFSNKVITTVKSKGYNIDCNSTSPFKVERAIQLVSTKQEGGGMFVPPDPPTNLNIAITLASKIKLTWDNSCGGDSSCSYSLYRSADGNTFSLAASDITASNYENTGLLPSTLYYYYVTAVNTYGESFESSTEKNTTLAYSNSKTFNYTGGQQTWSVPSDATSVSIKTSGAQGQGLGGESSAIVTVTPGETLYIYAGGQPLGRTGGWNGGGNGGDGSYFDGFGGGGASDVRRTPYALSNRLVVACGGGGGSTDSASGADGGGSSGGTGGFAISSGEYAMGGGGGTQISGGIGGSGPGGYGVDGSPGVGGNGGYSNNSGGGSGGGGGYYGGGGGGASFVGSGGYGGGGGGGSGYVTGYSTSMTSGVNDLDGEVIIEW